MLIVKILKSFKFIFSFHHFLLPFPLIVDLCNILKYILVICLAYFFGGNAMVHLICYDDNLLSQQFADIVTNEDIIIYNTKDQIISTNDELARYIEDLFWKLDFNQTSHGTFYLKRAIAIAFYDQSLIYDNKKLNELLSKEQNLSPKEIRGTIDNALNSMYSPSKKETLYKVFQSDYDNRKPSTKYFIAICVNYLNKIYHKDLINLFKII